MEAPAYKALYCWETHGAGQRPAAVVPGRLCVCVGGGWLVGGWLGKLSSTVQPAHPALKTAITWLLAA